MTIRPPGASCSTSGAGISGEAAATRIASYGANGRQPSVPSPTSTVTFRIPVASSAVRALCASAGIRSTPKTESLSSARRAVWYPEPAPISSTRSLPVSPSSSR